MREIKFRAWDKDLGMCDVKKMQWGNGIFIFSIGYIGNPHWGTRDRDSNSATLMQFTGLKDKNGREIYEGDILKWRCSKSGSKKEKIYTVTIEMDSWRDKLTIYDNGEKWATGKSYWNAEDREVIGNIYSNHDLLGVK